MSWLVEKGNKLGAFRPQRKGEDERKILYKISDSEYIVADIESGILVSDI